LGCPLQGYFGKIIGCARKKLRVAKIIVKFYFMGFFVVKNSGLFKEGSLIKSPFQLLL
jgi:hypothetical protein